MSYTSFCHTKDAINNKRAQNPKKARRSEILFSRRTAYRCVCWHREFFLPSGIQCARNMNRVTGGEVQSEAVVYITNAQLRSSTK